MHGSINPHKNKNCACRKRRDFSRFPLLVSVLLAVLPKCPFCIMAYSSAMVMCSGIVYEAYTPNWFSYLSTLLSLVILISLILNYRGYNTVIAVVLGFIGVAMVVYGQLISGIADYYWSGAFFLMTAALLNGNLWPLTLQLTRWVRQKYQSTNWAYKANESNYYS